MRILKIVTVVFFLASVPWAINYNLGYDRYGTIDRPAPPVQIQIVTVNAGSFNNTLKTRAAGYANKNSGVRIFVLAMTAEQVGAQEFDIRIIKDGGTFHAFVSTAQTNQAIGHCEKFLENLAQENETLKIHIN
jgi:hypothetical protein